MAKEFAKAFYNGKKWRRCRESFIAERMRIDGGLCQICHDAPGYIVHHHPVELTPDNINDPDVALSHRNLQYVCHKCHNAEHGYWTDGPAKFDAAGDLIRPHPPTKK